MSGIYGFWSPLSEIKQYAESIDRLALWNMAYGNAGEERFTCENISMGCYYEKLSDLEKKSAPVLKKDGKYAVIDAVLYNREELIIEANLTEEMSDEELIYAYIEKYGMEGLRDVNGDFCGTIYSPKDKVLTLFRDHMGVRPLFYAANEQGVVFSTDIRGLVSMEQMDVSVNESWLWNDIMGTAAMGTENTEFARIFCVKPASYITFSLHHESIQFTKRQYWVLGSRKVRLDSKQAYINRLRELITDSVKRRLDVLSGPVGAEMSGGLDSGIIDILINRLDHDAVYFSWSVSTEIIPIAEQDERLIIEDICKQENIVCNFRDIRLNFGEDSILTKKMEQIGIKQDQAENYLKRFVWPPYINTIEIGEAAQFAYRRGCRAVFTGHGGDEGVSHRCNPYELFYHREYLHYLQYIWKTTRGIKHRIYNTVLRCGQNLTKSRKNLRKPFLSGRSVRDLLRDDFYEKYSQKKTPPLTFAYDAITYIKAGGSRNRLDVAALLGAYAGARYIVPYLDYRVVDFAVSIPRHMYLKNKKNRYIFREAFKDMIPESLYNLNTKEEHSWKNYEGAVMEEDEKITFKQELAEQLDKEYWDRYLDWERIAAWVKKKPDEIDENYDYGMIRGISNCIRIQDVIARSRVVCRTNIDTEKTVVNVNNL